MNIKLFSEPEKKIECVKALQNVIKNTKLKGRQQRVYEILNNYNVNISGTNIEKLLHVAGFKTK